MEPQVIDSLLGAAKAITSFFGLAGFGLVIVLIVIYIATRQSAKAVPRPAWALLAFVIAVPLFALLAQALIPEPTYRVTVGVVDPNGVPVPAAVVTTVPDCIRSKTDANWRFDCSASSFGDPRVLTINAQDPARGMAASENLTLGRDRAQAVTVQLAAPKRGIVRGTVKDTDGRFLKGVDVFFVGYKEQKMTTNDSGEFALDAAAVTAQDLRVRAEKAGYKPTELIYPGYGDAPLVLERLRGRSR
jgi:hypothetical protein